MKNPRNLAADQAITWLYSMMADPDSFNAINAENCLAMIERQNKNLRSLGAHFSNLRKQRDRLLKELEDEKKVKKSDHFDNIIYTFDKPIK